MGRNKTINIHARAAAYKEDKFYVSDTNILMCGVCNLRLEWAKTDTLNKHILTRGHKENKEKLKNNPAPQKRQATIVGCIDNQKRAKTEKISFIHDTVNMCLRANIPINKMDHPAVREYLKKYIPGSGDLPGGNTLQSDYLPICGEEIREARKQSIKGKPVVIVADETSNSRGRCVFAVLLRTMTPTDKQEVFLASCSFLDVANGTNCCQAIIDTLQQYEVKYEHVMGLVSDSARYMGTCFSALQTLIGEHILHYQCWAHKVNLAGDIFMKELKELNSFITKVKMAFLHGRKIKSSYIHYLQTNYPELPAKLFPSPIITRWNSWFHSVKYICKYLDPLVGFFKEAEFTNTFIEAILEMQDDAVCRQTIKIQSTFVAEICQQFVDLINVLEGSSYPYAHLLWDDLENLSASLKQVSMGVFKSNTRESLALVPNVILKAKFTAALKECAQKSYVKINSHMVTNKTNNFYRAAHTSFNPAIAGQQITPNMEVMKTLKNKMPAFNDMSQESFLEDYTYFHRQLINAVKDGNVNLLQLLLAMRVNKKEFADSSLKTIWAPVNSVDAERFFSSYNLVLTDRRTRMKESTLETCAMLSFNCEGRN